MNEPLQFLHEHCVFPESNWVYILKGMSRNKDNDTSGVRFMRRMVIAKPDDIETCYNSIKLEATDSDTIYRFYVSMNPRNVFKAAFHFQKKMVDITMGLALGQDDALGQAKKIGSIWKTELEQVNCRATKRFLLDVDEDESGVKCAAVVQYICKSMSTNILTHRKTVSGNHLVINACDTRALMIHCTEIGATLDVQRDGMLFVEQWKGGE